MKKLMSKILCLAIVAIFFVFAVGSGAKKAASPEPLAPVDDYGYEDDYGYDIVTDDGMTEVARCNECGTLLESNEFLTPLYCDNCLYGSCVKCGVTLNPAKRVIYCENCEGKCIFCDNYAENGSSFCAECDAKFN